jgi:aspartokinase/homoserine dehydrogenase 1
MKIMKFGGTSVGNAANIKKVRSDNKKPAAGRERCMVVAFSDAVDDRPPLIEAGRTAEEKGGDGFYGTIREIGERHSVALNELFPGGPTPQLREFLRFIYQGDALKFVKACPTRA